MQVWDSLINAICRPYRISYKTSELLGGINGFATISRTKIRRQDFVITNKRDQRLQCSFWEPHDPSISAKKLPAVIYCHCNSGSRLDAAEAIGIVLPMGVRVFSLDFSGSGISEGDYVTLGANEVEDLSCLVDFIRAGGHTTTVALWGRSMGAVTSLLYSERDPSVAGLVLDSPFSKLTDLMRELAQEQRIPLWRMLGGTALKLMRRSVKKRAGFDINGITPVEMVPRAYVPAFFGHAKQDTFVRPHHSQRLHSAYAGDKEIMLFDNCDHNSPRPLDFYAACASFLARALHVEFDMHMLPSMMSDTSMLMPNEAGQTHSMPFCMLPFDSAHIPREAVEEEEGSSQRVDGAVVDIELQQALALSLESCAVSESVVRNAPHDRASSQASENRRKAIKELPFGLGSPEQKIPACAAVTMPEGAVVHGTPTALGATLSGSSNAIKCSATAEDRGTDDAQMEIGGGSGVPVSTATAVRRPAPAASHQDSCTSPHDLPAAYQLCMPQPKRPAAGHVQSTRSQRSRHAATSTAALDQAALGSATRFQCSSSVTATPSVQPAVVSHPLGVPSHAARLARSPAVSPGRRFAVLPEELAKSTSASVWNLYPA